MLNGRTWQQFILWEVISVHWMVYAQRLHVNNFLSSQQKLRFKIKFHRISDAELPKKLSHAISKREKRIIGTVAKMDQFRTDPNASKQSSTTRRKITSVTGNFGATSSNDPEQKVFNLKGTNQRTYYSRPRCGWWQTVTKCLEQSGSHWPFWEKRHYWKTASSRVKKKSKCNS